MKYGPSNFCVSPVLESPTTMPGRYTVVGMSFIESRTSTSAANFVDS